MRGFDCGMKWIEGMRRRFLAPLAWLGLGVGVGMARDREDFSAYSIGELAWATPGVVDKEFLNYGNWSDSCGASGGWVVEAEDSGEYTVAVGGRQLRGTGEVDAYIGAADGLLVFDDETGGVVFDVLASAGCPVTVAQWVDGDRDERFDQVEVAVQGGLLVVGGRLEFGVQGAGYGLVHSSGVEAVAGKWYRVVWVHGAAGVDGARVLRMHAYNLTDGVAVDFDGMQPGVQPWQVGVSGVEHGVMEREVRGLAVRVAGGGAALDNIAPLGYVKEDTSYVDPANTPRSWRERLVPGAHDIARVDVGHSVSYRRVPLGGNLHFRGMRAGGHAQSLCVSHTAGGVLTLGDAGLVSSGPQGGLELSCDVRLAADQEWHVDPVAQFVPGIHLRGDSEHPNPVLDLGGCSVVKTGSEDLWVGAGFDLAGGGRMTTRAGNLVFYGGGTFGDLKIPAGVTLRAEEGGVLSICNLGAGVTASPVVELDHGELNLGLNFVLMPFTLGGRLDVRGLCRLVFENANLSTQSGVRMSLAGDLTGDGELAVVAASQRPYADRIRLEGNNADFTGRIRVDAPRGNRTLQLRNGNAGSAAATWEVAADNVLEIYGATVQLGRLEGGGTVVNAHATNPAVVVVGAGEFSGRLLDGSKPISLVKTTNKVFEMSGGSQYSGDTEVLGGVLRLRQAVLADAAVVRVAAGARLELDHLGTDRVGSLVVDGVAVAAGIWGGPESGAPNVSAVLSGSGKLQVGAVVDPYAQWIAGFSGLSGDGQTGPQADPDGDGYGNLLEWALGGHPGVREVPPLFVHQRAVAGGLELRFRRDAAVLGVVDLRVEWAVDPGGSWRGVVVGAESSGPDADGVVVGIGGVGAVQDVTVTIPAANAVAGGLFARLRAVMK